MIHACEKLNPSEQRDFPFPPEERIHALRKGERHGYLAVDKLGEESKEKDSFTELDAAKRLQVFASRANEYLRATGREYTNLNEVETGSDGVGGKAQWYFKFAERFKSLEIFRNLIFDLFAMVCDDLMRYGIIPHKVGLIIDTNELTKKFVEEIGKGYLVCTDQCGVEINDKGSEFAHVLVAVRDLVINGYVMARPSREEKKIKKDMLKPGQYIIALHQEGMMRSNGATLIRDMAEKAYGSDYLNEMSDDMLKDIIHRSQPYTPLLHYLMGDEENEPALPSADQKIGHGITGFIHVTGGGIWLKGSRFLKDTGLSMIIASQFPPSEFSNELQDKSGVSGDTIYGTLSAGNGGYLVVESYEQAVKALKEIEKYNEIETSLAHAFGEYYSDKGGLTRPAMPVRAQIAGQIIETPEGESPFILLHNKTADAGEKRDYYKYYIDTPVS